MSLTEVAHRQRISESNTDNRSLIFRCSWSPGYESPVRCNGRTVAVYIILHLYRNDDGYDDDDDNDDDNNNNITQTHTHTHIYVVVVYSDGFIFRCLISDSWRINAVQVSILPEAV